MDADALVAAVAEFLPVPHVPELIIEDLLADTIDIGIASEATRERLFKKHGRREENTREFFRHRLYDSPSHTMWYLDRKYHRNGDLPATIRKGACPKLCWYHHGLLHRDSGPSIVDSSGWCYDCRTVHHLKEWRFRGRPHRTNGPAVIFGKHREWWVNGEKVQPRVQPDRAAKRRKQ